MWKTGVGWLDAFICHVWHSQGLYWSFMWISIVSLVIIAVERFLAVVKPFQHQYFEKILKKTIQPIMYVIGLAITIPGNLQMRYADDTCYIEYFIKGQSGREMMYYYSIIWLVLSYILPSTLFIVLYGYIVFLLRRRRSNERLGSSNVIDKANKQLTKTAIWVSFVFIVCLGVDSVYGFIAFGLQVTGYVYNSAIQKVGVFFAVMNSAINPFIYAASMPLFLRRVMIIFRCGKKQANSEPSSVQTVQTVCDQK